MIDAGAVRGRTSSVTTPFPATRLIAAALLLLAAGCAPAPQTVATPASCEPGALPRSPKAR